MGADHWVQDLEDLRVRETEVPKRKGERDLVIRISHAALTHVSPGFWD
jgi:hypothetical protein